MKNKFKYGGGVLATLLLAILFCFAACKNSSSSEDDLGNGGGTTPTTPNDNPGSASSNIDHSLGNTPNGNRLSEDCFIVKNCIDGIYLECTIPANTQYFRVYIDGVGQVAEGIQLNDKKDRGFFFYPFLDSGKEYTIRVVFMRDEDKDDDGFTIDYSDGDGAIGWFQTKLTAGAKSKGEVRLKDFGKIEIKDNGDFKFTKRLAFENEQRLTGSDSDWTVDIGLCEGISWLKPGQRRKWKGEIGIPQKELEKTHNFFTSERYYGDFSKIDFICYRPSLYYKYDDKIYRYMWSGKTIETPNLKTESELWTNIDITNSSDVAKIQGTWTIEDEWDRSWYHGDCKDMLTVNANTVKESQSYTYTKLDGSAFTDEELAKIADNEDVSMSENTGSNPDTKLSVDSETYKSRIYTLGNNYELSNDRKTLTEKYEEDERPLSEYFADCNLKLFDGGSLLRIIHFGTSNGEDYEYTEDYKKQ